MGIAIPTEYVNKNNDDAYSVSQNAPGGSATDGSSAIDSGQTNLMRIGRNAAFYTQGGFKFEPIPIPQGATILSATISIWSHNNLPLSGEACEWKIKGLDVDDATLDSGGWSPNYRPGTGGAPGRDAETTAGVDWDFTVIAQDTLYVSPDIAAIVKEIVDRVGWVLGNNIAFIVRNDGTHFGESFMRQRIVDDIDVTRANRFDCTYELPGQIMRVQIM